MYMVWPPYLASDIKAAESAQRRFTRILCQKANISFTNYCDRLAKLNLESLKGRRLKNDLILVYKILNNLVDINSSDMFHLNTLGYHNLRRHNLQISRKKPPASQIRNNFFSFRVIKHWNKLPTSIIESPTLSIFKHRLRDWSTDSS